MKNFNRFLQEADANITKLYVSDKLYDVLNRIITNNVASKIINNIGKDLETDVTYLDSDPDDSKNVTFMPVGRIEKLGTREDPYSSRLRQGMNWGKVINKLFPGEFTNMDIDSFYNRYRPEIDAKKIGDKRFKIVRGEDIRKWYYSGMYDGSISSCMKGSMCSPFFNIYVENPEKCGLLIYLNERGNKALGRALVWNNLLKPSGDTKENKDPYTLMDRIYYVDGYSQVPALFRKYAIDNGWLYKDDNSYYMNGVIKTASVTTRVKPKDYGQYPYMDTMQYFTPTTGRLSSTAGNPARDPKDPTRTFPRYNLRNQNGGYTRVY